MIRISLALCAFALLPGQARSQTSAATLPAGTPLPVKTTGPIPLKSGQVVRAELLYPAFVDNRQILPAGTVVTGSVVELQRDRKRRIQAELGGDFTPFRTPIVQFTGIVLPDGTSLPLTAGPSTDGAAIYRAVSPPPSHGGFLHRQFDMGLTVARDDLALFLGPGKVDRFRQFVYSQLPYHPQRIEPGTSWTIETTAPLNVPAQPPTQPVPPPPPAHKPHFWQPQTASAPALNSEASTWMIDAYLATPLSSEDSKAGEAIQAVVAQPVYNADYTVAVPQGAVLAGTVTRAKPSRRFGRTGVLSFNFQQLVLPHETRTVETRLTGADTAQNIALNSEGQAKSKPQDKLALPLILAFMAARPLDQEHGAGSANQIGKNGVGGAAGLGLIGTVFGLAGGSPYAAAGIGYWGAARAFYSRWIGHGQKITFAKDTRIVVETTPRRSAAIKPDPRR